MAAKAQIYHIVEGTSEPQDFQLLDDNEAFDGTGFDIGLKVYSNGTLVTSSPPTVAWLDQGTSTVRVSGIENLSAGEYKVRYTVTDSGGKIGHVPSGNDADTWVIAKPYA